MSVTGYMYNINATKKLGDVELQEGYEGSRSWHHQFRHSAYIYIGGLDQKLTEGDVVIVFSQFGEIVDLNLIRDKSTGKSKGFAFVCYEDQRSTVLAVDNMNGAQLMNRTLRVDHCEKYKAPKVLDEDDKDENGDAKLLEYKATGAEGKGQGVYNVLNTQKKIADVQEQKQRRPAGQAAPGDEDEAWAKAFEDGLKKQGGNGGKAKKDKKREKEKKKKAKEKFRKELEEIKRMKKEAKRLKKETKKAKEAAKMNKAQGKLGKEKSRGPKSEDSSEEESESSEDSSGDSSEESESNHKKKRKAAAR
uniref:RRM domain-containing protein n=1 Tax=Alexandrium catenella TaxID=2925 RepID=A0A7S1SCL7_ALECA|mmetsp:Transcript_95718/g.254169  ORF Transcript_95718/g.254169 Transcript_95718/m.254169 type:complete len:305 (+) Transcript_95718:82-996(+)